MSNSKSKLVLCVLVNVAVSFPMFVVGGSCFFLGGAWGYLGFGVIVHAVLSCVYLLFTLINPTADFITIDRYAICILGVLFIASAILTLNAEGLVIPFIYIGCLGIKWASHTYAFRHKRIPQMA